MFNSDYLTQADNMNKDLKVSKSVEINAGTERVWDALTNPEKVKTYLFGLDIATDWEAGSKIVFTGNVEGNRYEDKGNVLEKETGKVLKYDYWNSFSGLEDKPENYSVVTYRLESAGDKTKLTWQQEGFVSEEMRGWFEGVVDETLKKIKEIAEQE